MLNKKSFLFLLVVIVAAGLIVFAVYKEISGSPSIAFYDVPAEQVSAVQKGLKDIFPEIDKTFEWKIVPEGVSLKSFLEENTQTAFVFAYDQIGLFEAREQLISAEDAYFNQLPSTFTHNFFAGSENSVYAYPLLIDPVVTAYNTDLFRQLGLRQPDSLESFETVLDKLKSEDCFPLICAGGDDTQLFFLISAVQAMIGTGVQSDVFSALRESQDLRNLSPELKAVFSILIDWRKKGYIHPEWFRLVESDVSTFMQYDKAGIVCMPLSASRSIDPEINRQFTAVQLPLPDTLSRKNMPADILSFVRTKSSIDNKKADELQAVLSKQSVNESFAKETGLAPVFSSALTQDSEASSGRYWVAASQRALPSFGNASSYTSKEKAELANTIRDYFQVNGLGYE